MPNKYGHIAKVFVEIDDPTDAEIASLKAIAGSGRFAIAFTHSYNGDGGVSGDRMYCYMAMLSGTKKTYAVWCRQIPRGFINDAQEYGPDSVIVARCARGNQSLEEFKAEGVDGQNYGSGDPVEAFRVGISQHGGTSTKLAEIYEAMENGYTPRECVRNGFGGDANLKYANAIKNFAPLMQPKREGYVHVKVTVLYGPSGSGKTRYVHEKYPDEELYTWTSSAMKDAKDSWFDGYTGQRIVLFDEFHGQIEFHNLLSLLHGYAGKMVQIKGGSGSVNWCPFEIYFTSTTPMRDWYPHIPNGDHGFVQLDRRVTRTIKFPRAGPSTPPANPPRSTPTPPAGGIIVGNFGNFVGTFGNFVGNFGTFGGSFVGPSKTRKISLSNSSRAGFKRTRERPIGRRWG